MIEFKRYLDVASAEVDRALLAAHNIAAYVAADNEGGMAPHLSYISGVRLLVDPSRVAEARALLEAMSGAPGVDLVGEEWRTPGSIGEDDTAASAASTTPMSGRDPALVAYRTAIVGIFLLPVGLHLYSLVFVARSLANWPALTRRSKRHALMALILDVTVCVAAYSVWRHLAA